jgi:hypothetical protein
VLRDQAASFSPTMAAPNWQPQQYSIQHRHSNSSSSTHGKVCQLLLHNSKHAAQHNVLIIIVVFVAGDIPSSKLHSAMAAHN